MLQYVLKCLVIILVALPLQYAVAQQNSAPVTNASNSKTLTEKQKIEQLIQFIRSMNDATFIRNGNEHSCKEAADHLQAKWHKHSDRIKDADDFIEHLASKSSMSGEPYLIRFADGKTHKSADILHTELNKIEKEKLL
ncbi:DUF5329 family protein [Pontibacter silvestris]|uniref:DUF5329 family protein n=1 Tax=Pontibacter silvestris TaxID=2305183 RepID=A0ABW4X325_9BACT|nr:DUF5329 family protein [Pontibacter silvestris]MCC9137958.1 DUF5329 domain-containing protein [Pontibacter silvestris]